MIRIDDSRYFVTEAGDILSSRVDGRMVKRKTSLTKEGYYSINLRLNNKAKSFLVHRLVAIHFLPNTFDKKEINHLNGIKTDNRLENLEWATRSENQTHAYRNRLDDKRGERNSAAKLTEEDIINIRKSHKYGTILCKIYNVSHTTIYHIKNRRTWAHV